MTFIASLLFAIALAVSVSVIVLTISNAMPRITHVIEMEFAPASRTERRIFFGEIKGRKAATVAQVITFPHKVAAPADYRLAA